MTFEIRRHGKRFVLAGLLIVLPLTLVGGASALSVELLPVKTDQDINELTPSAYQDWTAWTANSEAKPNHVNAYVQRFGQPKVRVNEAGTYGEAGGFNGTTLLFAQWTNDRAADIWQIDLETDVRTRFGRKVNTRYDEFRPTGWGPWLLFTRVNWDEQINQVLLYNTDTRSLKVVATTPMTSPVFAGQVNGDFVVYERFRKSGANVFLYDITTGDSTKLPNSAVHAYAPGVAEDGTAFYARSGDGCAKNVDLVRYPLGGPVDKIRDFPKGYDVGTTYVDDRAEGYRDVLVSQLDCDRNFVRRWDSYKFEDSYTLTVVKEGTGDGTVTSNPPGWIDCGTDCTQVIPRGGSVVLIATPDIDSIVGWDYPGCQTGDPTCTVAITGDETVTVDFHFVP